MTLTTKLTIDQIKKQISNTIHDLFTNEYTNNKHCLQSTSLLNVGQGFTLSIYTTIFKACAIH